MGIWDPVHLWVFTDVTLHVDVVPQEDSLQIFSNWLKKGKAFLCTSDSSFRFPGEEVGLVSGISLHPRFEGAEGLY